LIAGNLSIVSIVFEMENLTVVSIFFCPLIAGMLSVVSILYLKWEIEPLFQQYFGHAL